MQGVIDDLNIFRRRPNICKFLQVWLDVIFVFVNLEIPAAMTLARDPLKFDGCHPTLNELFDDLNVDLILHHVLHRVSQICVVIFLYRFINIYLLLRHPIEHEVRYKAALDQIVLELIPD